MTGDPGLREDVPRVDPEEHNERRHRELMAAILTVGMLTTKQDIDSPQVMAWWRDILRSLPKIR